MDMRDGIRVRTTKDIDGWVADVHFIGTMAEEKRLLDDLEIPDSVMGQFYAIDKLRGKHLGYKAGPVIPEGSLGYVRLLDCHTLSHKRDKPGHVLGFRSNYWFEQVVVPSGTELPGNFHSLTRWYALELDKWDITGNKHGYARGLELVEIPRVNGYTQELPDTLDHPGYELPDYLEEIYV